MYGCSCRGSYRKVILALACLIVFMNLRIVLLYAPDLWPSDEDVYAAEKGSYSHMSSTRLKTTSITRGAEESDVNSATSIRNDMLQCSKALGVDREHLQTKSLEKVAQSASTFLNVVYSVVPRAFLPGYKNPCWYSNISDSSIANLHLDYSASDKRSLKRLTQSVFKETSGRKQLLCFPHFFVAGFPKSATTTLDVGIRHHRQIIGPTDKEPHWWTRGIHLREEMEDFGALSVVRYSLFFKPLSDVLGSSSHSFITYDASQSTLWDSPFTEDNQDYCVLPALMSRLLPGAKFVVLMRDPVERLVSHFIWSCKFHNGEDVSKWPSEVLQNGAEVFHEQVVIVIGKFNECLESASLYKCVNVKSFGISSKLKNTCGKIGHRLSIGIYFVHISKWLQFYSKEQFLFLKMEDFVRDYFSSLKQMTTFLDISHASKEDTENWFSEKANQRSNRQNVFQVQEKTFKLLREFYRPYNVLLAELLGDDRFLWNE